MSSSPTNPQPEPTMEEILASIRKIISEDEPDAAKPAAPPAAAKPVAPEPAPAPAAEAEVLELTDEVPAEPSAPEKTAPAAASGDDDVAFASDPAPAPAEVRTETPTHVTAAVTEEAPLADADDLISETTRTAVGHAFASMGQGHGQMSPLAAGTLDALFVQAVQGVFQPALKEWVDTNRAEVMNAMKPLIRAWMDEHLPPLIEAAVAKELARATKEGGLKR